MWPLNIDHRKGDVTEGKSGPLGPNNEPFRARTQHKGGGKWYMMVNRG